jgi:hypothetical protein
MTIKITEIDITISDIDVEFDVITGSQATRYYPGDPAEVKITSVVGMVDGKPVDIMPLLDAGTMEDIEDMCYETI